MKTVKAPETKIVIILTSESIFCYSINFFTGKIEPNSLKTLERGEMLSMLEGKEFTTDLESNPLIGGLRLRYEFSIATK